MEIDILEREFKLLVEQRQWDKLFSFIFNYFLTKPAAILGIAVLLLCCSLIFLGMGFEGNKRKWMKRLALLSYIVVILLFAIFNRDAGVRMLRFMPDAWTAGESGFHESNIIISVIDFLYFIPLGMLLRWQHRYHAHWLSSFGFVAAAGFAVEFLQYIKERGVASVGDFAAYLLGGMTGVALGHLVMKNRYR